MNEVHKIFVIFQAEGHILIPEILQVESGSQALTYTTILVHNRVHNYISMKVVTQEEAIW